MSTIKVDTIKNTSNVEVFTCKAWVNFNGTGTVAIRASGNVSSITDNASGNYTVNFTTAMPNANYAVVMYNNANSTTSNPTAFGNQYVGGMGNFTTSSVQMTSYSSGFVDSGIFSVAIFR